MDSCNDSKSSGGILEKKLKISRKHTSMVIIIMVLGANSLAGSYLIGCKGNDRNRKISGAGSEFV